MTKNELKLNGTQKFMGIDIPVIEGGNTLNEAYIGDGVHITIDELAQIAYNTVKIKHNFLII